MEDIINENLENTKLLNDYSDEDEHLKVVWDYIKYDDNFKIFVLNIFNKHFYIIKYFDIQSFINDFKSFFYFYFQLRLHINGVNEYYYHIDNRSEIKCIKIYKTLMFGNTKRKEKSRLWRNEVPVYYVHSVLNEINEHLLHYYIKKFNIFSDDILKKIVKMVFIDYSK